MDGSFLSQSEVIAASRRFVCIRLATYESAKEAEFLTSLFTGRSGELENTTFAVLAPDGRRALARPGRSTNQAFDDAPRMAEWMEKTAGEFMPAEDVSQRVPEFPAAATVRIALDIAACDRRPLLVIVGRDAAALRALEERMRKDAWSDEFVGRFVYARTTERADLAKIAGVPEDAAIVVVEPDEFGVEGKVLAAAPADAPDAEVSKVLREALGKHSSEGLAYRDHLRQGHQRGLFWETKLQVTDPGEAQARERGKGK